MKNEVFTIINGDFIDISKMKKILQDMNTVDIAEVFDDLSKEKIIQLFRILPKNIAADVFAYVDSEQQKVIIETLTDIEIGEVMSELFVDDAVDFIEEMPASVVTRVLANVPAERREVINQLLKYPKNSVGSIMTTEFIYLKVSHKVARAFEVIRKRGIKKETIYTCYIIDENRKLVGTASIRDLLLAEQDQDITEVMDTNVIFANTMDDKETLAINFNKYDFLAMPVVDNEHRLVGIVTVDDALDVQEQEATEDIEIMAAITPSHEPYLKTSVLTLTKNRVVWLLVLMLTATLTAIIIEGFEDAIMVFPALVAFIPMLMDTGGSAGSQSAVLIIRGMALNEVRKRDILLVFWKEIRVAALCGAALVAVNFGRVMIMNQDFVLALVTSLALYATVIMAKTVGCLLPIGARLIKMDPAVMASPVITTIADVLSLIIYFNLARIIMNI
ncbi:MAG: magnesium transporter [Spirochaetes bacterium]|nr:magnesium transporter [Spirochaetota bacterium]